MGIFEDRYNRECAEASYWMLYYPDHKADYENTSELDIILSTPPPRAVLGGKNSVRVVSDTTGSKGIRLASYDRGRIEEWLKLCEDVEVSLSVRLEVFLQLRRRYRNVSYKDGWVSKVQVNFPYALAKALGHDIEDIDESLYVRSYRTFREMWRRIERVAAWEAKNRGLF